MRIIDKFYYQIKLNLIISYKQTTTMNKEQTMHYPPVKGEYSYYDCRDNCNHFLIISNEHEYACQYSMKINLGNRPFITCHGIIDSVEISIEKSVEKIKHF